MLEALLDAGIVPDLLVGTSIRRPGEGAVAPRDRDHGPYCVRSSTRRRREHSVTISVPFGGSERPSRVTMFFLRLLVEERRGNGEAERREMEIE